MSGLRRSTSCVTGAVTLPWALTHACGPVMVIRGAGGTSKVLSGVDFPQSSLRRRRVRAGVLDLHRGPEPQGDHREEGIVEVEVVRTRASASSCVQTRVSAWSCTSPQNTACRDGLREGARVHPAGPAAAT